MGVGEIASVPVRHAPITSFLPTLLHAVGVVYLAGVLILCHFAP